MIDWRSAYPARVAVADRLGGDIDGAWWPRVDRMTVEIPSLVTALTPLLGNVTSVTVNWSHLQRPPDLNWPEGWEHRTQHVITVDGERARVNLLVVAYNTSSGLALMLLRRAAGQTVIPTDRRKPIFATACAIMQATLDQRAIARHSEN